MTEQKAKELLEPYDERCTDDDGAEEQFIRTSTVVWLLTEHGRGDDEMEEQTMEDRAIACARSLDGGEGYTGNSGRIASFARAEVVRELTELWIEELNGDHKCKLWETIRARIAELEKGDI